jgi:hypothetical protein
MPPGAPRAARPALPDHRARRPADGPESTVTNGPRHGRRRAIRPIRRP